VLISPWFFLGWTSGVDNLAGGGATSLYDLLTGDLGTVLVMTVGAFWPVAGLLLGLYLRWTGSDRSVDPGSSP
jgi:hypothetical protein